MFEHPTFRTSSYTSNYTEQDRISGVPVDFVLFIGKDEPPSTFHADFHKKIIAHCESRKPPIKYMVFGNGVTGVDLDDIAKLPKVVNNMAIFGHGNSGYAGHTMSLTEDVSSYTHEIVKKVQEQTGCENYLIGSCYSGKIIEDIKNKESNYLKPGTCVVTPSASDDASVIKDNIDVVLDYVKRIKPGKQISMIGFVRNIFKTIPQTMKVAFQFQDKLEDKTFLRGAREGCVDIERFCRLQSEEFNIFIGKLLRKDNVPERLINELKNEIPEFNIEVNKSKKEEDIKNLLPFEMSDKQISEFQLRAFSNYILLGDIDLLNELFHKNKDQLGSFLLSQIHIHNIIINKNQYTNPEKMLEFLLKYTNMTFAFGFEFVNKLDDAYQHTPLTLALEKEDYKIIKILLDNGADLYLSDKNGNVPAVIINQKIKPEYKSIFQVPLKKAKDRARCAEIYIASLKDENLKDPFSKQVNEILSKKGNFENTCEKEADKNFYEGKTNVPKNKTVLDACQEFLKIADQFVPEEVLKYAIDSNQTGLVRDLLNNYFKITTLGDAIQKNDPEIVKAHLYLLKNSENNMISDNNSMVDMLEQAMKIGHFEAATEILNSRTWSFDENKSLVLLFYTIIKGGNLKLFDDLLPKESAIPEEYQSIFLFRAIELGHIDIAKKLIQMYPVIIHQVNEEGRTPLHIALLCRRYDLIDTFWNDFRQDLNTIDTNGDTAFHCAVLSHCKFEVIKKMFYPIDEMKMKYNKAGMTPFHLAIQNNYPHLVKTLMSMEPALINSPSKNEKNDTPLDLAAKNVKNSPTVFRILLTAGAKNNNPLDLSNINLSNTNLTHVSLVKANLKGADLKGADLNGVDLTDANLSGIKNLRVHSLINAQSIRGVTLDTEYLKKLPNDSLTQLKEKMVEDYKEYIKTGTPTSTSIADLVTLLTSIIDDNQHPLKLRRVGISEYDNTASSASVLNFGREKLKKLWQNNPGLYGSLDEETQKKIQVIENKDIYSIEDTIRNLSSSIISFFGVNSSSLPADKPKDPIKTVGPKKQ